MGQLESVQLSYKVRLFKGALSRWSTLFCWQCQSRVFIRYGTWDVTCQLQNHSFVSNKYICQVLYQMIEIIKMNFWKNCKANKFSKTTIAIRFSLFQVCPFFLLLHFLCYFYLRFMFWAVYFNVSLSLVAVPTNLNCDKSPDTAPLNKNHTWNRTLNHISYSTKCMIRNLFKVLVCDDRFPGQWLCHVLHQPRDQCRQH